MVKSRQDARVMVLCKVLEFLAAKLAHSVFMKFTIYKAQIRTYFIILPKVLIILANNRNVTQY